MNKKYIELKKENIIFKGKTEEEKKANELIYDLVLENDALYNQNKELKERLDYEIQNHIMSDKNYCEIISNCKNILTEFEKWLEEKMNFYKNNFQGYSYERYKEILDKLQEIKEKTNG